MMYEGSFEEQIELESTKYPIHKQILEMEAIELHKLESLIIKNGGVILDRNTDAICYHRENEFIPSLFWDNEKNFLNIVEKTEKN